MEVFRRTAVTSHKNQFRIVKRKGYIRNCVFLCKKFKSMNQLIDNSTLLEVGEVLVGKKEYNTSNKEVVERKVENLFIFLHSLLVGDEINNSTLKINSDNIGVKYLLNKKIINPIKWDWEKENDLLKFVRSKILKEIESGVIELVMKQIADKVDFVTLVSNEISTYLLPEGLNHYWNNIGFENGDSVEAKHIYNSFKDVFKFTLIKKGNNHSIHDLIILFINEQVKDVAKAKLIIEWYWLSFLSNVIRAEYYINLARITKTLYSPLATRGLIINELIKDDLKEDIYILDGNVRENSIFLVFIYILEKTNWNRNLFIDKVLELKKEDALIIEFSELLNEISAFKRDEIDDDIQEVLLKNKINAFENKIFKSINYTNKNYNELRLFDKLPKDFFNKWL